MIDAIDPRTEIRRRDSKIDDGYVETVCDCGRRDKPKRKRRTREGLVD